MTEHLVEMIQYIPLMLVSYDWRLQHAGHTMVITAICEGTSKVHIHGFYCLTVQLIVMV